MKRLFASLLVLFTLFTFASCGKPAEEADAPTSATTAADEIATEPVTEEATEKETEPETSAEETTVEKTATEVPATTEADGLKKPETKKEAIAFYGAAVDKALAANKQATKNTKLAIAKPMDGDESILKLLKIDIAGFNVQNAFCDMLGDGEETLTKPMKDLLQASSLQEGDVTGFTVTKEANGNIALTINVKDCVNPLKLSEGGSPMGRFTWDFPNIATTNQGVIDMENTVPTLKITIEKKQFNYSGIQIKATIKPDGTFASLSHNYKMTARMEGVNVKLAVVKMGGGEWGQGNGVGTITYKF